MAQIVMAAQAAGAVTQTVSSMADAITHIQDVTRAEAEKLKEAARQADNEFNIRKQFLENAVDAIRQATCSQYNIVVRTDQAHDDFQNLVGEILPMDLIQVEVAKDKIVNFQVSVFDTGKYLRHGRWENDAWWYWGQTKIWKDPAAMHVHFEKAQPKLDPTQIKAQLDQKAQQNKTAADAKNAAEAAEKESKDKEAAQLKSEADRKAREQAQGQAQAQGGGPVGGDAGYPSDGAAGGDVGFGSGGGGADGYGSGGEMASGPSDYAGGMTGAGPAVLSPSSGPSPSFTSHMVGLASGPAMQMLMGTMGY